MQVPLEVSYKNVTKTEFIENTLNQQVEKLQRFAPDIISCRVALNKSSKPHSPGDRFSLRVEVSLPGKKRLTTSSDPVFVREEDPNEVRTIIRNTFGAMEKRLKKTESKKRRDVKTHSEPRAFVTKIFPEQGYGFLKRTDSDEEIYFHHNSVFHHDFDRLRVGTEVRYDQEMGDEGLQATSVQIVDKPGARISESDEQTDIFVNHESI